MEDKELLDIYRLVFCDKLDGKFDEFKFKDLIKGRAYNLGYLSATCGDDVSSIDYMTDEEILQIIRN